MFIQGIKVLENSYLTESESYNLSWIQRIFSWPWKPWRKEGIRTIPSKKIYKINNPELLQDYLVVHPMMMDELRKRIKEDKGLFSLH